MKPKIIVIIILIVLCFIILLQNREIVTIQFLLWKFSMSRIIMIAFLLLSGFFIGFFTSRFMERRIP